MKLRVFKQFLNIVLLSVITSIMCSCASTTVEVSSPDIAPFQTKEEERIVNDAPVFPPYTGPRRKVQIVRFGISADVLQKYPELAEKRIGWGLCNRLVEAFYGSGRFQYLEEKEGILKRILKQWELSQSGIYTEETDIETG